MLMADDRTKAWSYENSGEDDVGLCIDLGSLWDILEESPPDSMQNSAEDLLAGKVKQGLPELGRASSVGAELSEPVSFSPSYNSEASDYRVGASDGSVECVGNPVTFDHGKQELSAQTGSPASCSGSLSDWMFPTSGYGAGANSFIHNFSPYGRDYHDETCQEIPNYGLTFCFAPGGTNNSSDFREALDSNHSNSETEFQFNRSEFDIHSQYGTLDASMEKSEIENTKHLSEIVSAPWDIDDGFNLQFMSKNDVYETDFKDEWEDPSAQAARVHGVKVTETPVGGVVETVMGAPTVDDSNVNRLNVKCEDHIRTSPTKRSSFVKLDNVPKAASQFLTHTVANLYSKKQAVPIKTERNGDLVLNSSYDGTRRTSLGVNGFLAGKSSRKLLRPILPPNSSKNFLVYAKDEKEDISLVSKRAGHSLDTVNESASGNSNPVNGDRYSDVKALEQPYAQPFTSMTKLSWKKDEIVGEMTQTHKMDAHFSKFGSQPSNALVNRYHVDDESDVCILEDLSEPSLSNPCSMSRKSVVTSQRSTLSDPLNHMGMGGLKLKANDERLIYRVVLQDLSQPKTEASPPDGVLAVPLLRHQRIALSWMVQKETGSLYCSGGILADDQGLGKTISTIALILKERAPTSSGCLENYNQNERETLNLDEDDECAREQDVESCQNLSNGSQMRSQGSSAQAKGRLPAGTLVVCPTSVLRQWAEELHNKVTSKGSLSVLVYHGSNRTKDPCELAKYDVVLTTYSIVSMEVPKQPLDDVDDDETGRDESHVASSIRLLSCKKRKYPPTSGRSSKKDKKGIDSSLLESAARPLAGVRWFRVVLDEAQSIKNHRTQVARACWGLRAKRRWCLSGTPIQNAVDDLYSYFRFLRYDPYATYKSFCSSLKVPISRNPTNGYKKLQAVLKTVMLRRTKGTLLDGEPIINLPPKVVELKKVDFTKEERDFYCRLEADSRAQFAEYAAAGTVKQNYVNILLMLLRLRQACDHPLLVRGYDSSSAWRSSVEMAKILPREKQVGLLNCLEASLAICGVCNDPPEDAVVTSCGHVFCNQCICEHLTGDDNLCPTTNCKSRLSVSSVFSRATLKCSLTQEPGQDGTPDCSGSEVSDKIEYRSWSQSFDSSKIKAALKVLQSLSKPNHSTSQTSLSKSSDVVASWPKKSLDPFAIEEESDMGIDDNEDTDLVEGSNELIKVAGEKAIVFSQWTRMLDLLENCLKTSSIQYRRLDGTMSVVARDKAVKDFNSLPEVSVMIMSLKAASLGLNMVAACHVLLLDLWWNPTTEDQAVDRAHRIGQTRPVSVLRLTVKDTVEDRILALQQKKREMVASAFGEDETGCQQTRLTVEDLKYLFMA